MRLLCELCRGGTKVLNIKAIMHSEERDIFLYSFIHSYLFNCHRKKKSVVNGVSGESKPTSVASKKPTRSAVPTQTQSNVRTKSYSKSFKLYSYLFLFKDVLILLFDFLFFSDETEN